MIPSRNRSISSHLSRLSFHAALLTLPLVGVGTVHLLTGVDTGAGFQPAYLFLTLAYLTVLARSERRAAWEAVWCPSAYRWLGLAVLAALLLSGLGLVWRPAEAAADLRFLRFMKQIIQWVIMACFALAPLIWIKSEQDWITVGRLLAATLLFQLAYSLLQAVHFYHPLPLYTCLDGWFTSNPTILSGSEELFLGDGFVGIPRLRGTMCEPLYLGNYLMLVLPVVLLTWGERWWGALLAAAGLLLLVLTWARGAYAAVIVAMVVALILVRRSEMTSGWRPALIRLAILAVAATLATVLIWGPESLLLPLQRIWQSFHRGDWSNLTRFYSMQAAWRAFLSSPLVGVGWGQYPFHFLLLVDPLGLQSQFSWPVVNNFYLKILCETGLVGFSVFLWGGVVLAHRVWVATAAKGAGRRLGRRGRWRVVAAGTAVVGVWSQLLTFSQYNLPHIWVSLGLLLAALATGEEPDVQQQDTALGHDGGTGHG